MAAWSRREFVVRAGAALGIAAAWAGTGRAQGLGQFQAGAPGCSPDDKATPAAPEGPDFRPRSPERSSFLESGVTGTRLVLTGYVAGLRCGRIKDAIVDFWQADGRGQYDATGFRLRGHQLTTADGSYRLETIVPGPQGGRARRLHVRIAPPGKPGLTTQVFFPGEADNAKDPAFRPELVMKVTDTRDGKTASFNFVLDL